MFTLIKGEGQGTSSAATSRDFVVVDKRPSRAEQLTFASWANGVCTERLLSVGIDALDFNAFKQLLIDTGVRYVFDIRHLASFRGRGFSPALTETTFRDLGVKYERCFDLANEYVGTSRNQEWILHQYAARLRQHWSPTLDRMLECMTRAPLVLLGRERDHFGTEREVLVDMLAERQVPLELVVISERSSMWHWTSFLLGKPHDERDVQRSRNRPRRQTPSSKQMGLPEIEKKK